MKAFELKENLYWTGVLDPGLETFDIIMKTPHGSTYNAYFINDEKKVLIDTVKVNFKDEFIEKLGELTDIKAIDYIIVNHTEPDHSGSLPYILEINPNAVVYCTKAASIFLKEQINRPFKVHVIRDGEILDIGKRKLQFITAPFLHWSDTMLVYSPSDKALFTCDVYGSHYCDIEADSIQKEEYKGALQHYYNCIMKPFAQHYLNAHEKVKDLDIEVIYSSHGPILSKNPKENIDLYFHWSKEEMSKRNQPQVALLYLSAYKNTEVMAEKIKEGLEAVDVKVVSIDAETASLEEIHEVINSSKGILLGSPTINKTMVKPMWDVFSVIDPMANMGKIAGVFGSYGWGGEGIQMANSLLKQMGFKVPLEPMGKKFSPSEETLENCIDFGRNFGETIKG